MVKCTVIRSQGDQDIRKAPCPEVVYFAMGLLTWLHTNNKWTWNIEWKLLCYVGRNRQKRDNLTSRDVRNPLPHKLYSLVSFV